MNKISENFNDINLMPGRTETLWQILRILWRELVYFQMDGIDSL